jgi:hypothetical protein
MYDWMNFLGEPRYPDYQIVWVLAMQPPKFIPWLNRTPSGARLPLSLILSLRLRDWIERHQNPNDGTYNGLHR